MSFRILKHIGVVLGNQKVTNDYFLSQIEESQKSSLAHYYEDILGRDIRYLADENQTSLTLAVEASKKALQENHISGKEIDMVICISQTPEYTSPAMACFIISEIGGREDTLYIDMNTNCTGMLVAMDMADRYFKSDPSIKHILIVQGDKNSLFNMEKTSPFFGILSDVGCAIILERSLESAVLAKNFLLIPNTTSAIVYPKNGYSKPNQVIATIENLDARAELCQQLISERLDRSQIDQVKVFCISQFAKVNCKKFVECMDITSQKVPYVGDQYGYTGASSPLFALRDCIEKGLIERGDPIVFWTYGAGVQHAMLEIRY